MKKCGNNGLSNGIKGQKTVTYGTSYSIYYRTCNMLPKVLAHPKYEDMVKAAILALKDRNGSSVPAIAKYLAPTTNFLTTSRRSSHPAQEPCQVRQAPESESFIQAGRRSQEGSQEAQEEGRAQEEEGGQEAQEEGDQEAQESRQESRQETQESS